MKNLKLNTESKPELVNADGLVNEFSWVPVLTASIQTHLCIYAEIVASFQCTFVIPKRIQIHG